MGAWCRHCYRDGKGKNPHLQMHSPGGEAEGTLPFRPGKTAAKRRAAEQRSMKPRGGAS